MPARRAAPTVEVACHRNATRKGKPDAQADLARAGRCSRRLCRCAGCGRHEPESRQGRPGRAARDVARGGSPGHREVRDQPGKGEGGRLQGHHPDDPEHGLALPEPEGDRVRRDQACNPRLREAWRHMDARRARVGVPVDAEDSRRSRARSTARSAQRVTTPTGRSRRQPRRTPARRRARRAARRSDSGIRTS